MNASVVSGRVHAVLDDARHADPSLRVADCSGALLFAAVAFLDAN